MSGLQLFYHLTLGASRALLLQEKIGNFSKGKEADFIVLNPEMSAFLKRRLSQCSSLEEQLFLFAILGNHDLIEATFIASELAYESQ